MPGGGGGVTKNRVKGDKRNVSQLNRHNNTWPGNVREMSTIGTRLSIPKTFRPGNPYFSTFFHRLYTHDNFVFTYQQ